MCGGGGERMLLSVTEWKNVARWPGIQGLVMLPRVDPVGGCGCENVVVRENVPKCVFTWL